MAKKTFQKRYNCFPLLAYYEYDFKANQYLFDHLLLELAILKQLEKDEFRLTGECYNRTIKTK